MHTVAVMNEEQFARLEKQFSAIDAQLAVMNKRFDAVDAQLAAISMRLDATEERFEKRFAEIERRLDTIDTRLDSLDKGFIKLFQYARDLDQKIDTKVDKTSFDQLFDLMDGVARSLENDYQEHAILGHQIDRHEQWIAGVQQVGVRLTPV